ncbi:TetR/AcrR family transcriptional regulator [Brevibacillus sp. Leaf182]|uniref:TetR/AcrR family transcriptional regulator n=1 Tax=Brevibacillus sp. Leaf182 TaxID=1736290 RepID=UPI0006FC7798|nr:TetR/AcrR family transcriptional regulator [Brevibacillus sp. Leaf182]RAT94119.1 TetR/AcrR family transcriptional regulator [Brevibacillus sp. Leaf182]
MTKEKIFQAALRLFARKGFEATSIRDIALEAEVTSSTLYHYMKTKEDLLVAIMQEGLQTLLGNAKEVLAELEAPEQQLAVFVQLHVTSHAIDKLTALVVDTEFRALTGNTRVEIARLRSEYELLLQRILTGGLEGGVFTIENTKLAVLALLQMCTGVAHWYSPDGPNSLEEISLNFSDMALALVQAKRNGQQLTVSDLDLPKPARFFMKPWLGAAAHEHS